MATAAPPPVPGTSVTTLPSPLKLVSRSPGRAWAALTRPSTRQKDSSVLIVCPQSSGRPLRGPLDGKRLRAKRDASRGGDLHGARPLLDVDDSTALSHAR